MEPAIWPACSGRAHAAAADVKSAMVKWGGFAVGSCPFPRQANCFFDAWPTILKRAKRIHGAGDG